MRTVFSRFWQWLAPHSFGGPSIILVPAFIPASKPGAGSNPIEMGPSRVAEVFDAGSPHIPRGVGRLSMNETRGPAHASNDQATDELAEDFDLLASADCRFEVYRKSEQRVSSTKFCGGDWCWRLVTTEGHVLAEAAGYPNRGICEVVVAALRKNAASAPVHVLGDEDPR